MRFEYDKVPPTNDASYLIFFNQKGSWRLSPVCVRQEHFGLDILYIDLGKVLPFYFRVRIPFVFCKNVATPNTKECTVIHQSCLMKPTVPVSPKALEAAHLSWTEKKWLNFETQW